MTQNPHMKKNIELREDEMLIDLRSKKLYFKISRSEENGSCGSPFPQESLISPPSLTTFFVSGT
jgi:hypothetical protein